MYSTSTIKIDLHQVLIFLFCAYAFSLPFELILEIFFDIDTIFKPFRVFSLLIIGVYLVQTLRVGLKISSDISWDIFLYAVFAYGILISLIRIISGVFNFGLFYNDLFLAGLLVATFFVFKATPMTRGEGSKIFRFFILGVSINAIYTLFNFSILGQGGRLSGFMDNPNYTALGLMGVMSFFILKLNYIKGLWRHLANATVILFLIYAFLIAGSRTGLIMFIVANFLIFLFSTFRKKLFIIAIVSLIALFLMPKQLNNLSLGGPKVLADRINKGLNEGTEDVRFVVWRGLFKMLEDKGYVGLGIGQYKANFSRYYGEESNKLILEMVARGYYLSTHNDYLAILTDYGIPGLLFYLAFIFFTFKRIFRLLIYPVEDEQERFQGQYNFIMFTCLLIFGLAAENFQHQLFWFLLMFTTKSFQLT